MRHASIPALLLTLVLVTAPAAAAQSASSEPGATPLLEAFSALPSGVVRDIAFTDWDRIRASLDAQDLTGDSPVEAKVDVLLATSQTEAAASGFGLARIRDHRETWGFDTFDLAWEATYSVDGPPMFVLRFRDGVDLAPLAARLDERGFTTTEVAGAVVRSHAMDVTADWIRTTEFAILNTAFLDDGRTLILSSGLDTLTEVLEARYRRGRHDPASVLDTLAAVEGASAAFLTLGLGTCTGFTPLPFDPFDPPASIGPLPSRLPLHPYAALAVAYGRPDWDPVGRIAMGFLDESHASADLEARTEEARTGDSIRVRRPYSEAVFRVEDANVAGTALVLEVEPVDDMPRRLFQMVMARDMSFARC